MSCQRAIMHTVAFRAPLRPQPLNYIRVSTATAVQPASSPTSLATTPQKLTPFLVPAIECSEAERKWGQNYREVKKFSKAPPPTPISSRRLVDVDDLVAHELPGSV